MKIRFLGTGHGIAEKNRFCSSAVVECNDRYYVIDAGAPLMSLLQTYDVPFEKIGGIFITHTHEDHFHGLVEMVFQINSFKAQFSHLRIPVFVPDAERYHDMFRFLFGSPDFTGNMPFFVYGNREIYDDGNLRVNAIPNDHCAGSHSFELFGEGKHLMFTGDLAPRFTDYPAVLKEEPFDLVVLEGAHTNFLSPESLACLHATQTARMVFTHIYDGCNPPKTVAEAVKTLEPHYPVTIAQDGLEITL